MSSEGLERLLAWKKAKDFTVLVYRLAVPALPPEEKWNLGQQIRRSAQSIPANIAEGYGRYYYQEVIRFTYIARGSLEETISHILVAKDLGYLPVDTCIEIIQRGNELVRILNGYIHYLKQSKQGEREPGAESSLHEYPGDYVSGGKEEYDELPNG